MEEAPSPTPSRIFVGGLGRTVTASDLEKTFSSLGCVRGVEIIRTNGRSFAYMDFEPASQKAFDKLFSLYNGCIWKGGRLRLEKAKEHYLARLRREWAADAEFGKGTPSKIDSDIGSLEKSKHLIQEKMQLQIFFPKFKKVKSLPYSGTGKHKYSFQRVEVPSLPVHFCDCEEHCKPSDTTGREHLFTQIGGINEEELNTMNSVMSRLFEREAETKAVDNQIPSYNSDCLTNDIPCMEDEADQSMEVDNLVTNIVMQGNNGRKDAMQIDGRGAILVNQDSAHSKLQSPNDGTTEKQRRSKKRDSGPTNASKPMSKRKSLQFPADESTKDESPSIVPNKEKRSKVHPQEPESSLDVQPIQKLPKSDTDKSSNGLSWLQKSSWKELVGETGNSSFSISDVLPSFASKKQKSTKPNDSVTINSITKGQLNSLKNASKKSDGDDSRTSDIGNQGILKDKVSAPYASDVVTLETARENQASLLGHRDIPKESLQITKDSTFGIFKEPERKVKQEQKTATSAIGGGEVCPFMRCADSEKEWAKARAALSGPVKKKSNKNISSMNARGKLLH